MHKKPTNAATQHEYYKEQFGERKKIMGKYTCIKRKTTPRRIKWIEDRDEESWVGDDGDASTWKI